MPAFAQPPSGGCVLKRQSFPTATSYLPQPPSGGCVLKLAQSLRIPPCLFCQPPSGGCVLKHKQDIVLYCIKVPAAFRRLCVETLFFETESQNIVPAAFRRLCVETRFSESGKCPEPAPAAFRRLCVETAVFGSYGKLPITSRLQAAVC